MDIAAWLRRLGLARYEQAFRDNDVDGGVLRELTAEDLIAMGVASVGHRRKLLQAIAGLNAAPADDAAAHDEASGASTATPPDELAPSAAERRQLTVMFVDLVGSTELSRRMDPEQLGGLLRLYQNAVTGEVARFEGMVAKFMGDGVLAYFGWPTAHEDDAERAVRAALAIREVVGRLSAPEPLSVRIGIATGLVVVGDLVGEGAAREQAVVGDTPNLAARLQELPGPGSVVVAHSTRRLLGGLFELEDLGARAVKGFDLPLRVFRVLGEGDAEGRFEAQRGSRLLPLVGREHELALLCDRWVLAKAGEGQVVLLSGEAGIGKSRIVQALRERVRREPHTSLRYFCSPYHIHSALHPVTAQLERAAGFARDDLPEARRAKLEALLARAVADTGEATSLIAEFLGIPIDDRERPELTPQQRRRRTFQALLAQLEGLAARDPVLMLLDDAQWLDPTSLELFELMADRIRRLPVLLVVTHRPEFHAPWRGHPHVTTLALNRLARDQAQRLIQQVTGGRALPPELLEPILSKTEGVPLFVEELTQTVLEAGLVREEAGGYALCGPLQPLAIPATIQDSLMARLDRLAPVKEVAQIAACIGREFDHELLAAVADLPPGRLEQALLELVRGEIVFRRGIPPEAAYVFKHALVQDAAYESLLRSRRRELHGRIAKAIEERFPNVARSQPEWLARHAMEAGLFALAADGWLRAAQRAKDAYGNREANAHLLKCLEAIKAWRATGDARVPEAEHRERQALVVLGDLASLAGDLDEANFHYKLALATTRDLRTRRWIENKQHLPRSAIRDGARIAFYEHGGGATTLLYVAPLAYGLAAFQPIVERLCQEFRIVTVDPRGTGGSDPLTRPYPLGEHVEDVRAVIDALGGGPVVGVGISRGANLLLNLAHAEPRRFTSLVTIGAPPGPVGPPFFSSDYVRTIRQLAENADIEGIVGFHTALILSEPETSELRELFIRNRLQQPRETTLSFLDPDPTVDVTSILAEITVPTLVIHGREDRLVAFAAAEHMTARLANATLYAFEGKGHLPLFTAPDEFCHVVRRFVLGEPLDQRDHH